MIARLARRMIAETDTRVLGKFLYNFAFKGMRSVRRFSRRVKRGEVFPAFLFLSVTNGCNLQCQGCWVRGASPVLELDIDTADRVISEAKQQGVATFGILGGEPLLYPNLLELLGHHPDCYFLLFTNGTLIDDDLAEHLRRLANVSPLISVEGNQEVSDQRRGGTEVLARSLHGLASCTAHGLVTGVATSVCQSNFDDLVSERFVEQVIDWGALYLWYYIYRPVGSQPSPELALSQEQILALRRFMVEIRSRVPLLVVDSYWDHEGRALCPAAVGIGYHLSPAGDLEACPPIQFAAEKVGNGASLAELVSSSRYLDEFRRAVSTTTRGCILLENPRVLSHTVESTGAWDSSGRGTALAELEAIVPCASHHVPGQEIPEQYWPYRLAKKNWFFGFGAYG